MEGAALNRRLAGMTAVAAVLGGYLAYQGLGPLPSGSGVNVSAPDIAVPRSVPVKLNPLQDLDPATFQAIVDRPLFNPSRHPRPPEPVNTPPPVVEQPAVEQPPPPPPPVAQGPGPDDYKLLGVSSGPDGRIAAVRIASSGDVVYLRKGEGVDSWSVVDIGERTVAIGTPDNAFTYGLFANTDAAPSGEEGQSGSVIPGQNQPLPLPLPMPQPRQRAGQPPLPEQHTLPPSTGG